MVQLRLIKTDSKAELYFLNGRYFDFESQNFCNYFLLTSWSGVSPYFKTHVLFKRWNPSFVDAKIPFVFTITDSVDQNYFAKPLRPQSSSWVGKIGLETKQIARYRLISDSYLIDHLSGHMCWNQKLFCLLSYLSNRPFQGCKLSHVFLLVLCSTVYEHLQQRVLLRHCFLKLNQVSFKQLVTEPVAGLIDHLNFNYFELSQVQMELSQTQIFMETQIRGCYVWLRLVSLVYKLVSTY